MKRIDRLNIENILALTPLQEGILFHYLKNPAGHLYFEQLSLEISGEIEVQRFEKAWDCVIESNEMLRTVFRWEKMEKPIQVVLKHYPLRKKYIDLSNEENHRMPQGVMDLKIDDKNDKFDLHDVPFRVMLIKIAKNHHELIISHHHILYDGWSNGIILKEFFHTYRHLIQEKITGKPVKTKFKEYIHWLQSREQKAQETFWQEYLRGFTAPAPLSVKKAAEREITTPERFQWKFDKDTGERLQGFIHLHKSTLAAVVYSAWGLVLQKYNHSRDVIFGITVSGRTARINGIEDMVGLFINTIPLRIATHPRQETAAFLRQVNDLLREKEAYENTSLAKIKELSQLRPNEELFDTLVVIENYPLDSRLNREEGPLTVNSYSSFEMTNYDLTLGITLSENIEATFIYNRELLEKSTLERMARHFTHILDALLENPRQEVDDIDMLSEEEKRQILSDFNDTAREYLEHKTLHELFVEQVVQTPGHIALVGSRFPVPVSRPVAVTYRELHRKSCQMAFFLQEKGVEPGDLVGILVDRSLEMIIGILAILKSGCGYVPLNPKAPHARNKYILEECNVALLLTLPQLKEVPGWQGEAILIEDADKVENGESILPPRRFNHSAYHAANLAYVIFTSGSTGFPKGVPISHANLSPLLHWGYRHLGIGPRERSVQNLSYYFDWSVWEIFITLTSGASLYMVPEELLLNTDAYIDFMVRQGITVLHITPTQYGYLVNTKRKVEMLRYLFIGAEKLTYDLVERSFSVVLPQCRVFNMYGPTEATIISAVLEIDRQEFEKFKRLSSIPIGRPTGNLNLLILDRYSKLCALNIVGELYIAGDGLSCGYLNNPELTFERFCLRWPGAIFYKTGDLARWLPEGVVEYLGRIDHQVKIRGFRIELGEIENHLLSHPSLKEAVVIAKERPGAAPGTGEKYLCAYILLEEPAACGQRPKIFAGLKQYLSQVLPDYMIPSYFVILEQMPLNPNGKIDRKKLPEPVISDAGIELEAPRNPAEKKLREIYSDILFIDENKIGIHDDFFQLGGHSLKATRLAAKIHKAFEVNIPLTRIFKSSTIKELAAYIKETAKDKYIPIEPVERRAYYAASSTQKRMYILQQMDRQVTAYNLPAVFQTKTDVDTQQWEMTFKRLIERHESLRTSFAMWGGELVQSIHDKVDFEIEYYDLTAEGTEEEKSPFDTKELNTDAAQDPKSQELKTKGYIKDFIRPFDLSRAPLLRVGILRLPAPRHTAHFLLMIDMHHIITDGISMEIFTREFMKLYGGDQLPPSKLQYRDYSEWKNSEKELAAAAHQETYWLQEFAGEIPVLNLPADYPRPVIQDFEGSVCRFEIEDVHVEALRRCVLEQGATLYMVLLSLYTILLSKLTNREDIVVGTPVAGRQDPDIQNIIGMFVNTLALRNYPIGAATFNDFLVNQKDRILAAFAHQDYPYEDLVDSLGVPRDTSRNPLFDTMFVLQNLDMTEIEIPGPELKNDNEFENNIAKFDLMLTVIENGPSLACRFEYRTKLFKAETIRRFTRYFMRIVSEVPDHLDLKLSSFEIITEAEKKQILEEFNNTRLEIRRGKTIHGLFAEQAQRTPGAIAAKDADYLSVISYRELNKRADRLAAVLRENSVTADTVVGVLMERRLELMIALLGILKAGGAYLPIVPYLPLARQQYMVRESAVSLVLCHKERKLALPGQERQVRFLPLENDFPGESDRENKAGLPSYSHPQNAAYVIYTSGSTGKPKGVMIEHAQLINFVFHMVDRFNGRLGPGDNCLSLTEISFDVSVGELFLPLPFGAAIVFLAEETKFSGRELARVILEQAITFAYIPPALLPEVSAALKDRVSTFKLSLDKMLVGVEPIRDSVLEEYMKLNPTMQLLNGYGPTETTICATMLTYESHPPEGGIVPIGPPLANMQVLILDKDGNLSPVNIPGELCISGNGVGRGYLNNPELTAGKFCLRRPGALFEKTAPGPRKNFLLNQSPIYKTGDLAKWLENGSIRFMGRIDQQVKMKGYRIEPGEIENRLLGQNDIQTARVIVRLDEDNEKYLCGYIVSEKKIDIPRLKKELSKHLPDYMVPTYILQVAAIPVTPHGKLDLRALPVPEKQSGVGYAAPRHAVEEKLVDIWSHLLRLREKPIGIDDDFFELGGHSLKATILTAQIHKVLQVQIPLWEIFRHPTIRELSEYIGETGTAAYTAVKISETREYYPLSSAQKRLYILHQVDPDGIGYNIPVITRLQGEIKTARLENCFRKLLRRHESLRTSFALLDEEPFQKVHAAVNFEIESYHLTAGAAEENHKLQITNREKPPGPIHAFGEEASPPRTRDTNSIIRDFLRPFDLSRAPLFRVGLIKLQPTPVALHSHPSREGIGILMVDMHHIISDGTSANVIIGDFISFYKGEDLPPPRIQYKDFAAWQQRREAHEGQKRQEEYWLNELAGEIPVLNLPTDFSRPGIQHYEGRTLTFQLDRHETQTLKVLGKEAEVTMFMLLSALFNILLSKLGGQEDIVIGTPVSSRGHAELQPIIGMFVNTLPLRSYPRGEKSFSAFLAELKTKTLEALENQDYPFENLVEKLALHRDASRNPLFDVMLVLQNLDLAEIDIPGLILEPYPYESTISKFDMTFICVEAGENLQITVEYGTQLFKAETIEKWVMYFKKLVSEVIIDQTRRIGELEIISEEEKQEILCKFNNFEAKFETPRTIPGLFLDQVKRTPHRIAAAGAYKVRELHEKHLTYRELNHYSRQMAVYLVEKGAKPGELVGMIMERSVDMIVGILGILEAGCGYVPLNPKAPQARNRYLLVECRVKLLLTAGKLQGVPGWVGETIFVDNPDLAGVKLKQVISPSHPCDLAYVIFTSGSTGQPKGVPIRHDNFSPLLHWGYRHLGIGPGERTVQNLSYYFDWSVWEIFITLTRGAGLYPVSEELALEAEAYIEFIDKHGITILHITPTQYGYLVNTRRQTAALHYLFIGAEKLTYDLVEKSFAAVSPRCRVFNMYGPTEATIISAALEIDRQEFEKFKRLSGIPIGKPTGNLELLISDRYWRLCPVNLGGELYIGGDGLSAGYLNNPELTAAKFDHDLWDYLDYHDEKNKRFCGGSRGAVFSKSAPLAARGKFYKTGDLARWLPGGYIEFLGRIDHQVKIRGFRIEPGEIEDQLLNHEQVKEAVVIDRVLENGEKYLCAYVVLQEAGVNLREYLSTRIPGYMIPAYFVPLESIPLNPNGKTDRRALPEPETRGAGSAYLPPGNPVEERLVNIWQEILERTQPLGIDDNFFELGGHSLKATVLTAKLNKEFQVKISLAEIFKTPTIKAIAAFITAAEKSRFLDLEPVEEKEFYELSSNQKRLWFIHQLEPGNTSYNMPEGIKLHQGLDPGVMKRIIHTILTRHESLRTGFKSVDDQPVQYVIPAGQVGLHFKEIDLSGLPGEEKIRDLTRMTDREAKTPFDLSKPPLFRTLVFKLAEQEFYLMFTMHHIISDGWSMGILKTEFMEVYARGGKGQPVNLPPLPFQYKDFAGWEQRQLANPGIKENAYRFWRKKLEEGLPPAILPVDFNEADSISAGAAYQWVIPVDLQNRLHRLGNENNTTLFTVMLALFNLLLHRLSGQEDLVVGAPASGRTHASMHRIVGFFVNTIVLKHHVDNQTTFSQHLQTVKANVLETLRNQSYPLEAVLADLKMKFPVIQVFFNMLNLESGTMHEELESLRPRSKEDVPDVKFNMILYISEYKNGIEIDCHYRKAFFKPATIASIMDKYLEIIDFFTAHPGKTLSDQRRERAIAGGKEEKKSKKRVLQRG